MDGLSRTLGALADPTRRAILTQLARGSASVADLAQPFNMTVQAVSKHVRVLEHAGLVSRERDAQRRLSRLELAPRKELDEWLAAYRSLWDSRLDNIADVLNRIRKGELDDLRD